MRAFVIFFLTSMSVAAAQTFTDNSGKNIEPDKLKSVVDSFGNLVSDPSSVQLRRIFEGQAGIFCGQFNAKNLAGGYVGYRYFILNSTKQDLDVEPPNNCKYWPAKEQTDCPDEILAKVSGQTKVKRSGLAGRVDDLFAAGYERSCKAKLP